MQRGSGAEPAMRIERRRAPRPPELGALRELYDCGSLYRIAIGEVSYRKGHARASSSSSQRHATQSRYGANRSSVEAWRSVKRSAASLVVWITARAPAPSFTRTPDEDRVTPSEKFTSAPRVYVNAPG
jgi:hypothetical protein